MSSADLSYEQAAREPGRVTSWRLAADSVPLWEAARPRWARLSERGDALPFQRVPWLDAWYRHCVEPGVEPLIVFVQDLESGKDILGLPLIRLREGMKRVVTFADGGLTDYNAPAIGPGFVDRNNGRHLWQALRRALPRVDLIRFEKMPLAIDARPNPLAGLPGISPSSLIGNILHVPGSWEDWHWGLERTFRKELERAGRVFEKNSSAAFRRYEAGPEADRVFGELKRMQAMRIAELSLPYALDSEPARSFYDEIAREGLKNGTAILTALTIGDEVVAALLGITDGTHYAMTRLATPGQQWKNFSPGRLLIERTMKMLHADGFRAFDFTIGDYSYKRRIGVTPVPMVQATIAMSPLGWWDMGKDRAKAAIKRNAILLDTIRKIRGRTDEAPTH
jgi:CelD/BcsL family acetyltransferase involved in cellulose biosynthesis